MLLHFHVGRVPVTLSITKDADQASELEDMRSALLFYGMRLPTEGARARFVLRKWAAGGEWAKR